MNITELRQKMREYTDGLDDAKGTEYYNSDQEYADRELSGFMAWLTAVNYEIDPIKESGSGFNGGIERCSVADAEKWGVYARPIRGEAPRLATWVADFTTREHAEKFVEAMKK